MSISMEDFITDCLVAVGDRQAETWARTDQMTPFCREAIRDFPILRPRVDDHTNGASIVYSLSLPDDFREVISVEYPISQQPPEYLVRRNRLDPKFFDEAGYFDIDQDYSSGTGWLLWISGGVAASAHIKTEYLAPHDSTLADSGNAYLTTPDEYETILITAVLCRCYRERLGAMMRNPTANSSIVMQLTEMVQHVDSLYQEMIKSAFQTLVDSRITPKHSVDKYDRVY